MYEDAIELEDGTIIFPVMPDRSPIGPEDTEF